MNSLDDIILMIIMGFIGILILFGLGFLSYIIICFIIYICDSIIYIRDSIRYWAKS